MSAIEFADRYTQGVIGYAIGSAVTYLACWLLDRFREDAK